MCIIKLKILCPLVSDGMPMVSAVLPRGEVSGFTIPAPAMPKQVPKTMAMKNSIPYPFF